MDNAPKINKKQNSKTPPKNLLKRLLPLGILVAGAVLFFALGLDEYISFTLLAENYAEIKITVAENILLAWFAFFALYAIAVAFSLPFASVLTIGGGAVFGLPAFPLVVAGATLGAFILFLAARGAFAETLTRKAGPFMGKINEGFSASPFFWLLALRLIPAAPFWVVNIVPALLGMKARAYLIATAFGIMPGSFAYVLVGRASDALVASGDKEGIREKLTEPVVILPLVALCVLAFIPVIVRLIAKKRKKS